MKLYDYLPSQNGFKIRHLLQHLDRPYQHVPVAIFQGESRTPEFLEKNPVGAIPVLEPEPGVYVAESNAILCYLAEGTAYLPAERLARARVMQWLFFEQYYVEPTIGTLRFWVLAGKVKANEVLAAAKRSSGERALDALDPAYKGRSRRQIEMRVRREMAVRKHGDVGDRVVVVRQERMLAQVPFERIQRALARAALRGSQHFVGLHLARKHPEAQRADRRLDVVLLEK